MLCHPLRVKLSKVNWGHGLKPQFFQPQNTGRRSQARPCSSSGLSELNPGIPPLGCWEIFSLYEHIKATIPPDLSY